MLKEENIPYTVKWAGSLNKSKGVYKLKGLF